MTGVVIVESGCGWRTVGELRVAMKAKVLFGRPQREIASLLRKRLAACDSASLVAGFVTSAGMKAVIGPLRERPAILRHLVVGAANYGAFEACDRLLGVGVDPGSLLVHLGFTRATGRPPGFVRYHPMLHSKVYLMEMPDDTACALVGSHNLTKFALTGLNGEAAVLLEGPASSRVFRRIRRHVAEAVDQATPYESSMKEAYVWWAQQYVAGWAAEFRDGPAPPSGQRSIVVMAERSGRDLPRAGDRVYFEIPEEIETSLRTVVHLYLFDELPGTPARGLGELDKAHAFACVTRGVSDDQGDLEVSADWQIDSPANPLFGRTPDPFRPSPAPGLKQVRVQVGGALSGGFEYLFDPAPRPTWRPTLLEEEAFRERGQVGGARGREEAWYRVMNLARNHPKERVSRLDRLALTHMSLDSGNYILMPLGRRRLPPPED